MKEPYFLRRLASFDICRKLLQIYQSVVASTFMNAVMLLYNYSYFRLSVQLLEFSVLLGILALVFRFSRLVFPETS